ncbi:unnamed protein product [Moneuplotes crassus]|uniref:Uncharacterized protein n=1 Tax=Euplotes crassus TaxID=5936 RepID=A0AAD1XDC7_EUPCR|nr:unnamed protein product [Moneuplotes crassus]
MDIQKSPKDSKSLLHEEDHALIKIDKDIASNEQSVNTKIIETYFHKCIESVEEKPLIYNLYFTCGANSNPSKLKYLHKINITAKNLKIYAFGIKGRNFLFKRFLENLKCTLIGNIFLGIQREVKGNLKFYIRNICSILSTKAMNFTIAGFKINHPTFCRIVGSCYSVRELQFINCQIEAKDLSPLASTNLSIENLMFIKTDIDQEEEDDEDCHGFIERIASPELKLDIGEVCFSKTKSVFSFCKPPTKEEYSIGEVNILIY